MRLQEELDWLKRRFNATGEELATILCSMPENTETIPLSIFQNDYGILECVCRYLASQGTPLKAIARKLHRSYSTITNTLLATKGKPFSVAETTKTIPLSIFSDRKRPPLQALVLSLRDERKLRFVTIAQLLKRDPRNINATYWQARQKVREK